MPYPPIEDCHSPKPNLQIVAEDIAALLRSDAIDWSALQDARLLITGGTGFIGRWLLETLVAANQEHQLNLQLHITTRNPEQFSHLAPHLAAAQGVTLHRLDLNIHAPSGSFTHILHAATDARADLNEHDPMTIFSTIVDGTRRVLECARQQPTTKCVFLSSGAIYGQQPPTLSHVSETALIGPDPQNPRNAYAEAKRTAELLCALYRKQYGVNTVAARIFSLLGPFLALDVHFAAGNFLRDALAQRTVEILGNGRPIRSYLYPADLAHWLLVLLTRPTQHPAYNLGSEHAVSLAELAQKIADHVGNGKIHIHQANDIGWNTGPYVPSTRRFYEEFGLRPQYSLDEAIVRTARFHGAVLH